MDQVVSSICYFPILCRKDEKLQISFKNWSIKAVIETVLSHFIRNVNYLVWSTGGWSDPGVDRIKLGVYV